MSLELALHDRITVSKRLHWVTKGIVHPCTDDCDLRLNVIQPCRTEGIHGVVCTCDLFYSFGRASEHGIFLKIKQPVIQAISPQA